MVHISTLQETLFIYQGTSGESNYIHLFEYNYEVIVPYFHYLLFNNATSQHFTGKYCTFYPSTFCLADVVTSYFEGQD